MLQAAEISMEGDGFIIKILDSICLTFHNVESMFVYCFSTILFHSQSINLPKLQMRRLRLEKVACLFLSDTTRQGQLKDQTCFLRTLTAELSLLRHAGTESLAGLLVQNPYSRSDRSMPQAHTDEG